MTVYARMIAACGLSIAEAAAVCQISESSSKKRYYGLSPIRSEDVTRLAAVYLMVSHGMVDRLSDGCKEASEAQMLLRGKRRIPPTRMGRLSAVKKAAATKA